MTEFKPITDKLIASGQIQPEDIARAKAEGVTLIINNRPDGEAPDQPEGNAIESAAHGAGLDYAAIPIGHGGFGMPQVEAMTDALARADGKVLAFCRTGTRSTLLWALTEAKKGGDPEVISRQAAAAGYDTSPVRQAMEMLAKG